MKINSDSVRPGQIWAERNGGPLWEVLHVGTHGASVREVLAAQILRSTNAVERVLTFGWEYFARMTLVEA